MTATAECSRENITDLVVLDNEDLSFRARGVLLHLSATYPPNTQISTERLLRDGEGREAIRTVLTDLAKHGYLRRGRGTAWVWIGDPTRRLA